ncbi:3-hydroxyacyl-CoA dehydrogenase NAD-binding domain-containing protein [Sphingomonas tabacisoli]|uniref:3-hydroxyacyl-CoA dehydrogenase NAD-binding domain-containing protein n=1 Tax=Sphingomonas tabacisoli TaxID=2249466 RepID=A0ABW4I1W1_9SPHN
MSAVLYERNGSCAIIRVNHPPVNVLSHAVRAGIVGMLERAIADPKVDGIVLAATGRTFIAGADITEFNKPASFSEPTIWNVIKAVEDCRKPVVAAIHGTALGGGLEIAMACHARVAVASAKVGLPEVQLGILPGAGGTQRTPRLTGPEFAIDFITKGNPITAHDALKVGLVDEIVDDLILGAVARAEAITNGPLPTKVIDRQDRVSGYDADFFRTAKTKVAAISRGAEAPLAIIECIKAACTLPPLEGLAFEKAEVQRLLAGQDHAALKHYFFAEREARKIDSIPEAAQPVRKIAVIGAGTMGSGIAMACANAGFPVSLIDIDEANLSRGRASIDKNYAVSVSRGSSSQAKVDAAIALIEYQVGYGKLQGVDLVIEAVYEDLELKKRVFAQLDAAADPDAILATNTSSLDIDAIARATNRPEKVVGMHFFAPANVMRLLENVRGSLVAPETVAVAMAVGRALGKVTVLAGNCDGFIGNRMVRFYMDTADFLLEAGISPGRIDKVATDFGMPIGPLTMWDMVGLDTGVLLRKPRRAAAVPGDRMSPILERMVAAGRLGQKVGRGFYAYDGREKRVDPEALALIADVVRERGAEPMELSDEDIRDRLFMPLVNEGANELLDGTALRAGDIDVVWVNGYGFPAHKGGPMWWGHSVGLDRIVALAARLAQENGPRWAPSPLLLDRSRSAW